MPTSGSLTYAAKSTHKLSMKSGEYREPNDGVCHRDKDFHVGS